MKKFLIITVIAVLSLNLFAEDLELKMEQLGEKLEAQAEKMAEKMAEREYGDMTVTIDAEKSNSPYLGVFPKDLTLTKVRELNYDKNYGVLISGTVKNGPAFQQKIFKNDIIFEIDGRKVIDNDSFNDILKAYSADETVEFKLYSNNEYKIMNFTFGSREKKRVTIKTSEEKEKKSVDWNSIAINWIPRYYKLDDIDDVNGILNSMDFDALDEGLFMNGFGFRVHVGGGFYLGGEWSWYETDKKTNHIIEETNVNVLRNMTYTNSFGGVTLDKRISISKYFQPGIGFLIGGGSQKMGFSQSDGNYDWDNFSNNFDNVANNSMTIKREYVVFQPRADIYIPILSWVGIRGEVSYLMGYSKDSYWVGSNTNSDSYWEDSNYHITNSPETKCDGLMFSIGPWIEF